MRRTAFADHADQFMLPDGRVTDSEKAIVQGVHAAKVSSGGAHFLLVLPEFHAKPGLTGSAGGKGQMVSGSPPR